jgi:hypothetical protein
MIAKAGFLIFAVSLAIAVFTSNVFISSSEKSLSKKFRIQRQSGVATDVDAKHAHTNLLIANVTRVSMVVGLILVIVGYFFD